MSLIPKRQLPNVNNEKTRRLNSVVIIKLNFFHKKKYFL
jgi:hypothetical protein